MNETEPEEKGETTQKRAISMMRGVIVDLNQILRAIFIIVSRLQVKKRRKERKTDRNTKPIITFK